MLSLVTLSLVQHNTDMPGTYVKCRMAGKAYSKVCLRHFACQADSQPGKRKHVSLRAKRNK